MSYMSAERSAKINAIATKAAAVASADPAYHANSKHHWQNALDALSAAFDGASEDDRTKCWSVYVYALDVPSDLY